MNHNCLIRSLGNEVGSRLDSFSVSVKNAKKCSHKENQETPCQVPVVQNIQTRWQEVSREDEERRNFLYTTPSESGSKQTKQGTLLTFSGLD